MAKMISFAGTRVVPEDTRRREWHKPHFSHGSDRHAFVVCDRQRCASWSLKTAVRRPESEDKLVEKSGELESGYPPGMLPVLMDENGTVFRFSQRLQTPGKEKEKYMENPITENVPALLTSAAVVKQATEELGAGIPMVQNTPANIGADLDALSVAHNNVTNAKAAYNGARMVEEAIATVSRNHAMLTRDVLKPHLGREYNVNYEAIGLYGSSTLPYTTLELLPILQAQKNYFVANPTFENEALDVTSLYAQELYDQLFAAYGNTTTKSSALQSARVLRDKASAKLRKRMRAVLNELDFALDPLDSRWEKFGFNKPGASSIPDVPKNLSVILIGPSAAAMKWDASARAESYRVWKKVHGANEEFVLVDSRADLDFVLENLPANSTIEIAVSAMNNGGESQLSPSVIVTTPA